jgi:hypothetical protein
MRFHAGKAAKLTTAAKIGCGQLPISFTLRAFHSDAITERDAYISGPALRKFHKFFSFIRHFSGSFPNLGINPPTNTTTPDVRKITAALTKEIEISTGRAIAGSKSSPRNAEGEPDMEG